MNERLLKQIVSDLHKRENAMRWLSKQNDPAEECRAVLAHEAEFLATVRVMLEAGISRKTTPAETS